MSLKLQARPERAVVPGRTLLVDVDLLLYLSRDPDEPLQNVLHSVKLMLLEMQENTKCEHMRCILSSPTNFRYEVAENYKANRKDKEKPPHYQATKDYLIEHWDAEIARDNWEADDEIASMAICACQEEESNPNYSIKDLVTATLDKDFFTVSGWHYKWRGHHKNEIFWVNEEDAEAFLCYQLLVGDSADHILSPVKPTNKDGSLAKAGFGHVKARDFLLNFTYSEMREAVRNLYVLQGFEREFEINYKLLAIGRTEV